MRLVIMDAHAANPGDLSWSRFEDFAEVVVYERTPRELIVERACDADMVFTNKVVFDEPVLSQLPKLRYIGVLATGVNAVDLDAASRHGVVVTNVPSYSTDSVAQLVFAHLLNAVNRADYYAQGVRAGRWARSEYFCYWDGTFHELATLTFGVYGLGNIGRKVAQIAAAFGMRVLAVTSKAQSDLPNYITKVSLEELLKQSDVLSLHCPLTPETQEMINKESLALMKPSAILINTGRGPLINEADVNEALNNNRLAAYCADVLWQEPPAVDNPLTLNKKAYLTPHLAWGTIECRTRLFDVAYNNIKAWLEGKPQNVVN